MAAAPLLHRVPSLTGWPGSPSMLMTVPAFVETTWPQPTPQKGQTVVVGVEPSVLSGGTVGPQPAWVRAPAATAPVASPPRNWRRVGCVGPRFTLSSLPTRRLASTKPRVRRDETKVQAQNVSYRTPGTSVDLAAQLGGVRRRAIRARIRRRTGPASLGPWSCAPPARRRCP